MKRFRYLLGSQSPRRKELLAAMDIDFECVAVKDVEEIYPDNLAVELVPEYLSKLKAEAYRSNLGSDDLLITADTVVILDGEILGKPADEREAIEMIGRLIGREHDVVTGVTLTTSDKSVTFSDKTRVTFARLGKEEIEEYVKKYRPLDKAGAYGVQEWIGMVGVEKIDGCFYNVMGLPTPALYRQLRLFSAEK